MRQQATSKSITNSERASLEKYLNEIGKEATLSADEEAQLARLIRQGDRKALEKLTKANLRFVVSVARQYQNKGISLPDLINEGNLGLIKAAEKFDETRGVRFISYAVWWIRHSIQQAIAEQSHFVRLPQSKVNDLNKIGHALSKFEQENQRKPSVNEMSARTSMPEEQIVDAMKASGKQLSVDAPFHNGEANTLLDVLADSDSPQADDEFARKYMGVEIAEVLSSLDEREREVITDFYGIGQPALTMMEIGQKYGLKRERVRQIRDKAIRKLRRVSHNKSLKSYLSK